MLTPASALTGRRHGLTTVEEVLKVVNDRKISSVQFQWVGLDLPVRTKVSHASFLESHIRDGIGVGKFITMLNLLEEATPQALYGPESSEFRIIPDLGTFEQITRQWQGLMALMQLVSSTLLEHVACPAGTIGLSGWLDSNPVRHGNNAFTMIADVSPLACIRSSPK